MAKKEVLTQLERIEELERQSRRFKAALLALYRGKYSEFKKILKLKE